MTKMSREFTRPQWRTLVVLWVTYGSFYLCRVNVGPVRTEIEKDLGIGAVEMGVVLGSLKIGYAIGELVNGQLAERFGPKRVLLFGMIGSLVANVLFALAASLVAFPGMAAVLPPVAHWLEHFTPAGSGVAPIAALLAFLAFLNGYFQAAGWPPTVKVMSNWFTAHQRGRMMGVLGTSYQLGSALTISGAGLLATAFGNWRAAFLVPASLFMISTAHALFRLREKPDTEDLKTDGGDIEVPIALVAKPRLPMRESIMLTITNPRIWILAVGLFGLDVVRYGFLDWAPGHLQKAQASGVSAAALKTAVLPLAGAAGALVSGWVTDRYFQSRRAPVIAILLLAVGALTLAYSRVVEIGVVPTVLCLGAIGFCLYGAQILIVGTAAQDFARGGATAAAAGFIDFMGYVGAFSGDIVTGWLLKTRSFTTAITFWAAAAVVAAVCVATLWRARPVEDAHLKR
jgi:OPA family glycerol-3-phosphate transporter-like MFS transporter